MIKKFIAWVKSLFTPVPIKESSVDEYIAAQQRRAHIDPVDEVVLAVTVKGDSETARTSKTVQTVRFVGSEDRALDAPVKDNEIVTGVDVANGTVNVTTVEIKPVERSPATPPKRLNDQLREVELPAYAQGKKLPPKAKRKFIAESKRPVNRQSDLQTRDAPGIDPGTGLLYGATAAAILASEDSRSSSPAEAPVRVEECAPAPSYTPSYSDNAPSHYSSDNSSSSYSGGGDSSPSCD